MAGPTFVDVGSVASSGFSNVSSLAINAPATITSGNLLSALVEVDGALSSAWASSDAPAGWTLIDGTTTAATGGHFNGALFWKIATGSEPSSYTFSTPDGSSAPMRGWVSQFTGNDSTTPINAHSALVYNTSGSAAVFNSVTTGVANTLIVLSSASGGSGTTTTTPATTNFDDSFSAGLGTFGAYVAQASSGASGTFTWTYNSNFVDVSLFTMAIAPSGGGGFTAKNRRTIGYRVGSRSYY